MSFGKPKEHKELMKLPVLSSEISSITTIIPFLLEIEKYGFKKIEEFVNEYQVPRRNLLEEYLNSIDIDKIDRDANNPISKLSQKNAELIYRVAAAIPDVANEEELKAYQALQRWKYPFRNYGLLLKHEEIFSALKRMTYYGYIYSLVEQEFLGKAKFRGGSLVSSTSSIRELNGFEHRVWWNDDEGINVRSLGAEKYDDYDSSKPSGEPSGPVWGIMRYLIDSGFYYGRVHQGKRKSRNRQKPDKQDR